MARKSIQPKPAPDDQGLPREAGETAAPEDKRSFEELLAEAESLARQIEEGGMPLDEAIRAYEKGVANLRRSADLLKHAEEKVQVLLERNGTFRLEDFENGDAAEDNYEDED